MGWGRQAEENRSQPSCAPKSKLKWLRLQRGGKRETLNLCGASSCLGLCPVLSSVAVLLPHAVQELPNAESSSTARLWALPDGWGWQRVGSGSTGGALVGPSMSATRGLLIFYWS